MIWHKHQEGPGIPAILRFFLEKKQRKLPPIYVVDEGEGNFIIILLFVMPKTTGANK